MFLARIFTQHLKRNRWQMPTIKVESCVPTFEQEAIFWNLWKHEQNQYTHYTYIITESYISSSVHGSFWHGKWFISFVLKQTVLSTGFNSWILNTHHRMCAPNFVCAGPLQIFWNAKFFQRLSIKLDVLTLILYGFCSGSIQHGECAGGRIVQGAAGGLGGEDFWPKASVLEMVVASGRPQSFVWE